ncbi:pyridoxamine 5'-phosphate oxidase family protein [Ktedonosporobacter rubrisoli]|uniref:Pyridoxamine 5'-phosphate oxidase family protein n=1 Tax=Ktedonosporobacter rubrisoli TaxID=2509675 RepID=A0A4P6JLY6_KTERU|nr:pyridoxamine 5'-phosphate oxidase family protein [Ktedonosporobacter rubrisoli]QBD76235.1 pyridoxamine 5'-phosphate oxidase family protein [Ktedonosporobacter rubrisoli]
MPKDYNLDATPANKQRRPQHAREDEWIKALLTRAQIAHIATRWEEQPFINPTTYWYDSARNTIFFHSNIIGRVRANSEQHDKVCLEVSEFGKLLPSNLAVEFSLQYASAIVFGTIRPLSENEEKRYALYGLIQKYFPHMSPGKEYRPITDKELVRTSVYAIEIESWSGKENWEERADQGDEWPPLPAEFFA